MVDEESLNKIFEKKIEDYYKKPEEFVSNGKTYKVYSEWYNDQGDKELIIQSKDGKSIERYRDAFFSDKPKLESAEIEEWKEGVEILHTYEFEIPQELYDAMLDWCNDYAGQKSGYFKKMFGVIVPHILRGWFGIYIHNLFVQGMEENAVCSELLRFLAVRFWNFDVPKLPYPENFTTQDMMQLLEDNGAKKIK